MGKRNILSIWDGEFRFDQDEISQAISKHRVRLQQLRTGKKQIQRIYVATIEQAINCLSTLDRFRT